MSHEDAWLASAVTYTQRFKLSVIPMGEDKRPLIKWAELQERRPSLNEVMSWPRENLAIITGAISNLVVVDCESREDATWFWQHKGTSPVIVQTRRGFHFYFRHPYPSGPGRQRIQNDRGVEWPDDSGVMRPRYDVRGDGGYVLAPPSRHSQGAYRWVQPLIETEQLPVFDPAWRPVRAPAERTDNEIRNAVAYISRIKAISGSGGHDNTYRAACVLHESGLSEAEALLALQQWNQANADPPWSDRDLLHKIRSAFAS